LIKDTGERINTRTVAITARGSSVATDDATLVAAAKSGDDEAFELLVNATDGWSCSPSCVSLANARTPRMSFSKAFKRRLLT